MGKLEELKSMLKELSPEEMEQLKSFIAEDKTEDTPTEEPEQTSEPVEETAETPTEETSEEVAPTEETTETTEESSETTEGETSEELPAEEQTSEEPAVNSDETAPAEEEPVMEKVNTDEGPASEETETPETETSETTEETSTATNEDDALIMRKGAEPSSEEESVATSENITADDGSEIPIDYKQIIEGQNAKIAALEAENASLKSKVDGAFGYSAKPTAPGKVNPLYDDAIDNVRFRK